MDIVGLIFGRRKSAPATRSLELIEAAPVGVWWRHVRPAGTELVRARKTDSDGSLRAASGDQRFSAGEHYIVTYKGGEEAVVRADIFEKTYRSVGHGKFKKRTDIVLRYFTLDHPAMVRGLEGDERAEAGDWIMEGVVGELWPIDPEKARRKYAEV